MDTKKKFSLFSIVVIMTMGACTNTAQTDLPNESGNIDAGNGVMLFYQKVGNGPNHIILPMGLYLYEDFRKLAAPDRTLVFYDVRNRGRSSHVTDSTLIGIWQDVHDLETVRSHFGYDKVSLVGWSYLGMMVMLYATQHPDNIERIVQVGPVALKWDEEFPSEYRNTGPSPLDTAKINEVEKLRHDGLNETDPRQFTQLWYGAYVFPELFYDSSAVSKFRPQLLRTLEPQNELHDNFLWHLHHHFTGSIQHLNTDSLWTEVSKIEKPVLTIHGKNDRNAAYGSGRQWAALLPDARLLTIENAAHLPWLEKPEEVFPAIDAFLKGAWPDEATKSE